MVNIGRNEIELTYLLLGQNFDKWYSACQTDDQKARVRSCYVTARDAFYAVVNKSLVSSDPLVQFDIERLGQINGRIRADLGAQDIAAVVSEINDAVSIITKLVTLVAV